MALKHAMGSKSFPFIYAFSDLNTIYLHFSGSDAPEPSTPSGEQRFATVRKSYTLPHNMNSAASTPSHVLSPRKRKDLSNFFGLHDDGKGSPSKNVIAAVAMQNLPAENCNEKIEKYLGIKQQPEVNNPPQKPEVPASTRRPRPKSLHGLGGSLSISTAPKAVQSPLAPALNKTLARLQNFNNMAKSAPTTPDTTVPNFPASNLNFEVNGGHHTIAGASPRRRNLANFLGGLKKGNSVQQAHWNSSNNNSSDRGRNHNSKQSHKHQEQQQQQQPQPQKPQQPTSILKKQSNLSKSTPMDLEIEPAKTPLTSAKQTEARNWQSSEGLNTPTGGGGVSGGGTPNSGCPTPVKQPPPLHGLVLRVAHGRSASDERRSSLVGNGGSITPGPGGGPPLSFHLNSSSASNSPYHTIGSLGRGRSPTSRGYHTSSLQRGGLGPISKARAGQFSKQQQLTQQQQQHRPIMARSATLDDLEPMTGMPNGSHYEPVMWVQRSGSRCCHTCCCGQMRNYTSGQPPAFGHHFPSHQQQPRFETLPVVPYGGHRGGRGGQPAQPVWPRDFRSHSVVYEHYQVPLQSLHPAPPHQQDSIYLSMNSRKGSRVVIPVNGTNDSLASQPQFNGGHAVQTGNAPQSAGNDLMMKLRESSVDPEYAVYETAASASTSGNLVTSKVVSMGSKTCISVNESPANISTDVSTQAIVHTETQKH